MEGFDLTLGRGRKPRFDDAPVEFRRRVSGVDYIHLKGRQNGDLFMTRHGWEAAGSILPERWFTGAQFSMAGRALAGATGAVYRVPVAHPARSRFAVVVKFSRFGQDERVDPRFGRAFAPARLDGARPQAAPFDTSSASPDPTVACPSR